MPEHAGAAPLDYLDLLVATCLVVAAGLVSVGLRLGLEGRLGVAALRTVVQLLLVGYVLQWIFRIDSPTLLVGLLCLMVAIAGRAAVVRSGRTFTGAYPRAFLTLVLTATATTFTVTHLVIGVTPWYRPQYVIPLMGMVLGNGLTGISLCLDQVLRTLSEQRPRVEMDLALGATRWEAARDPLVGAVRSGMIPILNSMAVVGIVSLPGMMTGQILQGADPLIAVEYQIVVMFMIAAATSLGAMLMALLVYRRLFNRRHQLLWREIRKR